MTAPTLAGPVASYRFWVVQRRLQPWGWDIRASRADVVWSSGQIEARCLDPLSHHAAPAEGCRCGIYAVDSMETAERYRRSHHGWRSRLAGEEVVLGAVHLWGAPGRPVIVGDVQGKPGLQYRAPFARIVALADSRAARKVGPELGVPVVRRDYLEAFAREMGGEQLRPQPRRAPAPRRRWPARPRLDRASRPGRARAALRAVAELFVYGLLLRVLWPLTRGVLRAAWWVESGLVLRSWQYGLAAGLVGCWFGIGIPAILIRALLAQGGVG